MHCKEYAQLNQAHLQALSKASRFKRQVFTAAITGAESRHLVMGERRLRTLIDEAETDERNAKELFIKHAQTCMDCREVFDLV